MTSVLLLHHCLGRTPGVLDLGERLRAAGHDVAVPDLYDGRTFTDLDAGVAHARELGDAVEQRARAAAEPLPDGLVLVGLSLGNMAAMALAVSRPGVRGVVLVHGCAPLDFFGGVWPRGMRLQVHTRDADAWGDADDARELVAEVPGAELFLYGGSSHLFTDASTPDHDPADAALVEQRLLAFLDELA